MLDTRTICEPLYRALAICMISILADNALIPWRVLTLLISCRHAINSIVHSEQSKYRIQPDPLGSNPTTTSKL